VRRHQRGLKVFGGRWMHPPAHTHPAQLPPPALTAPLPPPHSSVSTLQLRNVPSPSAGGGCHRAAQHCTHGLTAPTTSERDTGGWSGAEGWERSAWYHTLGGSTSPLPRSVARHTPHTQGAVLVRGPPPVRADGGALTHGELRSQRPPPAAMPRTRAQQLRETMEQDGWASMPEELFEKVLEALQPVGPSKPQDGGLGFSQALAAVRLVCAGWKAVHDAMVTRLVLRRQTTDEAVGMLVRRFPAVVSVEVKGTGGQTAAMTDEGVRSVSSLPALTFLDLTWCRNVSRTYRYLYRRGHASCEQLHRAEVSEPPLLRQRNGRGYASSEQLHLAHVSQSLGCYMVTDAGLRLRAVSNCTALITTLDLRRCNVTNVGVRALSCLPALTSLNLSWCRAVTDVGLRAVRSCTALTFLDLRRCNVTNVGVRALSCLPALTSLDLRACGKVTAAGVQALRNTTAAPNLHIETYV
jgi:hypothetical protein